MYALTISLRAQNQSGATIIRQASLDVIKPSLQESDCLFFDVLFDDTDPLLIRFYEAYTNRSAFQTHLEAPHTKAWAQVCMPHVEKSSICMPESESDHGLSQYSRSAMTPNNSIKI